MLRIGGCVIGGALAPFTIVFLMPHMVTIAGARREIGGNLNSNHMAQYNPQAIREVQRILRISLATPAKE